MTVLIQMVMSAHKEKLQPNWEGPYRIFHNLLHEAYKLHELMVNAYPEPGTLSIWNTIIVKLILIHKGAYRSPMYELLNVYKQEKHFGYGIMYDVFPRKDLCHLSRKYNYARLPLEDPCRLSRKYNNVELP